MTRKVWITGLALVVVGVLAMVVLARPPMVPRVTPMDQLALVLLGLVPVLGLVCATVGAVMLALALAGSLLGRPLVTGHRSHLHLPLLLAGLGAVVLAEVVGAVVSVVLMSGPPLSLILAVSHVGGVLQMAGSALLAIWLTGRLSASPAPRVQAPAAAAASDARGG